MSAIHRHGHPEIQAHLFQVRLRHHILHLLLWRLTLTCHALLHQPLATLNQANSWKVLQILHQVHCWDLWQYRTAYVSLYECSPIYNGNVK